MQQNSICHGWLVLLEISSIFFSHLKTWFCKQLTEQFGFFSRGLSPWVPR